MPTGYIVAICTKFQPIAEAVIEAGGGYIE
uniref:Uncharacterized protein n=1 Tax=Lepeophtheirus salmonis TaxID=72036 RepID=A0A0K2VBQ4_LEPSM